MRISSLAVLIGIMVSSAFPVLAFYPSGMIDKGLSYDNIEIIHGHWVSGKLYNRTNKPIKVDGVIKFVTIHKQVLNYAQIYVTVPPKGSTRFHCRLIKDNYKQIKHAYNLQWDIMDFSNATNRHKSKYKSIGYTNTGASGAFVKVSGVGDHKSGQFELKNGLYIVKVRHIGKHHCRINLLHRGGRFASNITNGDGCIVESKTVKIELDGYFFLDVSADGDWTVRMEYQEPKTAQTSEMPDRNSAEEIPSNRGTANAVVIKLKNGRTIHADYYWEAGDKLKVSIYDAIMTVDKKNVKEIVAPTP